MFEGRPDRQRVKGEVDRTARYKSRDELEVPVSDGATLARIFDALGLGIRQPATVSIASTGLSMAPKSRWIALSRAILLRLRRMKA